jgi:copper chaperone CopZ
VCAHAVRVVVEKIEGVQSVKVSLKEGVATIQFVPANRVTLAQIREAVGARVVVAGQLPRPASRPGAVVGANVCRLVEPVTRARLRERETCGT